MVEASALVASNSLRLRTLTAVALGPLVIALILWLPTPWFAVFFAAVMLGAAWEWCALAGIRRGRSRSLYLVIMTVCMAGAWAWPDSWFWLFAVSSLWWAFQAVRLLMIRQVEPVEGLQGLLLPVGLLALVAPWAAVIDLHRQPESGPWLVLSLIFLIWTADSMAYFTGRRWGRAKLAPAVSPGKTRVGVYGAMVGAGLCVLLFGWLRSFGPIDTLLLLLICEYVVLISVIGDLYESFLKRRRGVKDSSRLLPGHGGLLDRIDSLTAAAPAFVLGLTWAFI